MNLQIGSKKNEYGPHNTALKSLIEKRAEEKRRGNEKAVGLHSGISDAAGQLIGETIVKNKIKSVLEIGLANGFSSLYILDALDQTGGGLLTILDPFQKSDWDCRGIERVREAGFISSHVFIEKASWQFLPEMIENDARIDCAFVDGSHSFDNAFVDFYLIDKLLKKGSFLIFDDVGWAGVEKVVHYAVVNRDYIVYASLPRADTGKKLIKPIKRIGGVLARTHRTPDGVSRQRIEEINKTSFVVLCKQTDFSQEQPFKHF